MKTLKNELKIIMERNSTFHQIGITELHNAKKIIIIKQFKIRGNSFHDCYSKSYFLSFIVKDLSELNSLP